MYKIVFVLLALVAQSSAVFSQKPKAGGAFGTSSGRGSVVYENQTTEEEYNYVTKGYRIQIESGLDMKKGYTLRDLGSYDFKENGHRSWVVKGLYRDGQSAPCAIMLIYKRLDSVNPAIYYYCVPTLNAPELLWDKMEGEIRGMGSDARGALVYALLQLHMETVAK